ALLAGAMLFALAAYQWYLITTTGQSIAKKWLGMRIVKVNGAPINFVSGVILRDWLPALLRSIPYFRPVLGLTGAVMISQREQRCLHDVIAGPKVIVARPAGR